MIYKVVQLAFRDKWSFISERLADLLCCYSPGQMTVAPTGTLLFAFSDLASAKTFLCGLPPEAQSHYEIWECDMPKTVVTYDSGPVVCPEAAKYFWKWFNWESWEFVPPADELSRTTAAPRGTILVDSITLRTKVQ